MNQQTMLTLAILIFSFASTIIGIFTHSKVKGVVVDPKKEISDAALKLFIQAQKSGLVGPDKMAWVVNQLYLMFPTIGTILGKQTVEVFAQLAYDQFQKWIDEQVDPNSVPTPVVDPTPVVVPTPAAIVESTATPVVTADPTLVAVSVAPAVTADTTPAEVVPEQK